MNRATDTPAGVGLPWLVASALVGAAGMWLVLTHRAPPPAATSATRAVATPAAPSASSAVEVTSPWPAPAPRTATVPTGSRTSAGAVTATAVPMANVPPGADPADYALDDATLARRARTQFGLDCPGIAERAPRRSGHLDVVCSNGLVLRVYLMGDGPPRIAPGH